MTQFYVLTAADLTAACEKADVRRAAFMAAKGNAKEMARVAYIEAAAVQNFIETRFRAAARKAA